MASRYLFGVSHNGGRTAGRERDRRQAIAARHGCEWTEIYDKSGGWWKSWFSCPNRGEPFDSQTADAVMRDVKEEKVEASDG